MRGQVYLPAESESGESVLRASTGGEAKISEEKLGLVSKNLVVIVCCCCLASETEWTFSERVLLRGCFLVAVVVLPLALAKDG